MDNERTPALFNARLIEDQIRRDVQDKTNISMLKQSIDWRMRGHLTGRGMSKRMTVAIMCGVPDDILRVSRPFFVQLGREMAIVENETWIRFFSCTIQADSHVI